MRSGRARNELETWSKSQSLNSRYPGLSRSSSSSYWDRASQMFRALAELESVRNFNEVALSPAKQVIFLNRADGNLGHRAFSWTDLVRAYFLPGPLSPCPGSQHLQGAARSRSLTVFCPKTLFFRRKVKKWKNFSLEKLFDKTLFLFFSDPISLCVAFSQSTCNTL